MIKPTIREELKLFKKGYRIIAGLDEVGRGSIAGPVAAAAVIIPWPYRCPWFKEVRDSKKLSFQKREEIFNQLKKYPEIKWAVGYVSSSLVDKYNILSATKMAMISALKKLLIFPEYLLIDGGFVLDNIFIKQKVINKGDEKVFSIALASVIAKVSRDRLMKKYHRKYPQYRFDLHKGYATRLHLKRLYQYGPCQIHRKSFRPVTETIIRASKR